MTQDFDEAPGSGQGGQDTGARPDSGGGQGGQDNQQGDGASGKRKRSRGSRGRGRRRKKSAQPDGQGGNPQGGAQQQGAQPGTQAGQGGQGGNQPQRQPQQQQSQKQQQPRRDRQPRENQGGQGGQGGNQQQRSRRDRDQGQQRDNLGNRAPRPRRPGRGDQQPGLPSLAQPAILDPTRELTEEELEAADRAALAKANALADAGIMPSVAAVLGQPTQRPGGQRDGNQRDGGNREANGNVRRQNPQQKPQKQGQPQQNQQSGQQRPQKPEPPRQPASQAAPQPEKLSEDAPQAAPAPQPEARPEPKPQKAEPKADSRRAKPAKPDKPDKSDKPAKADKDDGDEPQHLTRADSEIVEQSGKKGRKKMFIGVLPGELVEVVLTEEGAVQEYYVEMLHQAKTKGNIYKGYIHNIDAALQAAFINYGAERNGFLQIDEVHPEYYQGSYPLKKGARFPLIQKVLKAGQEVLIQVVKEPTGKKGAFVSSYLSLPGRYFVYTLGRDQQGVSRKIEDEKERERLKSCIDAINPPEGVGLIVRTAGIGRAKTELMRDYKYLHRLWTDIKKKAQTEKAPALVYQELELAVRAARDYLTQDVAEVWVDDPETFEQIKQYVALAFPKRPDMVRLHADHDKTLWERFGLTRQVEQIYSREVTLPSGGRLVFDHTEALTSVDINSGKIGGEQSFAKMAHKTNMEAAAEISRQLKLRDIGGQVVIDFIEMKDSKHLREVEKVMRQALKYDRARTDVSSISPFGLMELVRQRLGSSAISVSTEPCPCCGGTGIRRNLEWQALQTMKTIHRMLRRPGCPNPLQVPLGQELAIYMLNNKRELLTEMGAKMDTKVEIIVDTKLP